MMNSHTAPSTQLPSCPITQFGQGPPMSAALPPFGSSCGRRLQRRSSIGLLIVHAEAQSCDAAHNRNRVLHLIRFIVVKVVDGDERHDLARELL
jgi:hypothetical protein